MDFIKVILTSLLSAIALFIIAKILGHKQVSQLDLFDYINGITIGSIAAELATDIERPWKPLIAMIIYAAIALILSIIPLKAPKTRKLINGAPTIIMNNGELYRENMKKVKLDLSEFLLLCRKIGYFNINEIQTAIFEADGKLSILPKARYRPLTSDDIGINVNQDSLYFELIMDGRMIGENLKKLSIKESWLKKQIKDSGYTSEKEIFLCVGNSEKKIFLYPYS